MVQAGHRQWQYCKRLEKTDLRQRAETIGTKKEAEVTDEDEYEQIRKGMHQEMPWNDMQAPSSSRSRKKGTEEPPIVVVQTPAPGAAVPPVEVKAEVKVKEEAKDDKDMDAKQLWYQWADLKEPALSDKLKEVQKALAIARMQAKSNSFVTKTAVKRIECIEQIMDRQLASLRATMAINTMSSNSAFTNKKMTEMKSQIDTTLPGHFGGEGADMLIMIGISKQQGLWG